MATSGQWGAGMGRGNTVPRRLSLLGCGLQFRGMWKELRWAAMVFKTGSRSVVGGAPAIAASATSQVPP